MMDVETLMEVGVGEVMVILEMVKELSCTCKTMEIKLIWDVLGVSCGEGVVVMKWCWWLIV